MADAPVPFHVAVAKRLARDLVGNHLAAVVEGHYAAVRRNADDAVFAVELQFDIRVGAIVVDRIEGGQHALAEFDDALRRVLHLDELVRAVGNACLHPLDLVVEQPAHQVNGMDGLVDDDAAAFLVPRPLPIALGVIFVRAHPGDVHLRAEHLAQLAAFQHFFRQLGAGVIPILENNAERLFAALRRLHHRHGVLILDGHRLFRQHVYAVLQGINRNRRMHIVRRAAMQDIQVFLCNHFLIVKIIMAAKLLCLCFRPVFFNVADGNQLACLNGIHRIRMHWKNVTATNNTHAKFLVHHCFLHFCKKMILHCQGAT